MVETASEERTTLEGALGEAMQSYLENKISPLELYDLQLEAHNNAAIQERMSHCLAWTFLPGRDRKDCPDFVDMLDARLVTLDRFPGSYGGVCDHVGLSVYRISVGPSGAVKYGGPSNCDMFKDFSQQPSDRAIGLRLDANNPTILKTGLLLNWAVEQLTEQHQTGLEVTAPVPPPVYFGFRMDYIPNPEWHPSMEEAVRQTFHPSSPVLSYFKSPGGKIVNIERGGAPFQTITIEKEGSQVRLELPIWVLLADVTKVGNIVDAGQPLADLPRQVFLSTKELLTSYEPATIWWLRRRVLCDVSRTISADRLVVNADGTRELEEVVYRCVPAQFVRRQSRRAERFFMDMSKEKHRNKYSLEYGDSSADIDHPTKLYVRDFGHRPTYDDAKSFDRPDSNGNIGWIVDLMSLPERAAWYRNVLQRTAMRGIAGGEGEAASQGS